jgi:hypothetical protein
MNDGTDSVTTNSPNLVDIQGTSGNKTFKATLPVQASTALLKGGSGNDNLTVVDAPGVVPALLPLPEVDGGKGNDVITVPGYTRVDGGPGADTIYAHNSTVNEISCGNSPTNPSVADSAVDTVHYDAGVDLLSYCGKDIKLTS